MNAPLSDGSRAAPARGDEGVVVAVLDDGGTQHCNPMAAAVATVVGGDSGGEVVNAFRLTRASSVETPLLLARQVSIQSTRIRGRLAVPTVVVRDADLFNERCTCCSDIDEDTWQKILGVPAYLCVGMLVVAMALLGCGIISPGYGTERTNWKSMLIVLALVVPLPLSYCLYEKTTRSENGTLQVIGCTCCAAGCAASLLALTIGVQLCIFWYLDDLADIARGVDPGAKCFQLPGAPKFILSVPTTAHFSRAA
jgi:hypothetical protein